MSDSAAVLGKEWRDEGFFFSSALPLTFGVALLNLVSAFFQSPLILSTLLMRSMWSLSQGQSLPERLCSALLCLRSGPQKPLLHKNTTFHHRANSRYSPLWGKMGLLSARIR